MTLRNSLVWFRRDLRVEDHAALHHALRSSDRPGSRRVYCAFVFDTDILAALPARRNRRLEFIRRSLVELDGILREHGGGLIVRQGRAREVIPALARELAVDEVHANQIGRAHV